ncbi:MAG: hypothetical protein JST89_03995 [Cyanobacteria bacterium SZAS-4]|nr:hypothetical protein [Cyanobacteria bacterium SZAS-4]
MNIKKELHESSMLKEDAFCSIVVDDITHFEIGIADLNALLSIAEEHDIALWQVVAVATRRLRNDIAEHQQQISMGI